jgi:hypothetical protein
MGKGYYKTFYVTTRTNTHGREVDATIHGGSYSIPIAHIDFVTWKKNHETGEFWVKLHTISGKEIRLRVTFRELNEILQETGNENVEYKNGENENENMEY